MGPGNGEKVLEEYDEASQLSQTRILQIRRACWQLQDVAINTQIVHSQV